MMGSGVRPGRGGQTIRFRREVPVAGEFDLVVAGGGMAGFGAACAAGRAGLRTLLVERQAQLGGMGTAGGVGNFCYGFGAPIGNGRVFDDVLEAMASAGAIGERAGWQVKRSAVLERENHTNDHAVLPLVLQRLARAAGVELLLCTDVVGAATDRGRITELVLHNRSLLQAMRAPLYVDATGDAILARHAGARTLPVADPVLPQMIKPSLMIFLRRIDGPAPARQPLLLRHYGAGEEPDYSVWAEPRGRTSLKFKLFDYTFDTGSGAGLSGAEEEMRARIPEVVRHFQEHHDARFVFDFAAPVLGVREGRRVRGDYVLGVGDVRAGSQFADSVAHGSFTIDAHNHDEVVPPYQIPYRSLVVAGLANCFVAGRCFSADRPAMASARIMATSCLAGQAVAHAAALALCHRTAIREVDTAAVRDRLLADSRDPQHMRDRLVPRDHGGGPPPAVPTDDEPPLVPPPAGPSACMMA
ncbi:MAG: FAD-dependent oxidoreductase [Spirochaetaceae bacterium]|nr:FAD-dependent oxidoreductase [Spirochaetaceae bacterium]